MIYLDHAATTPLHEKAVRAMNESMESAWFNPSAAYGAASGPRKQLRLARRAIAGMLNADVAEIIFTSGGSEGNSLALNAARGKHAVVSSIEHASVIEAAKGVCESVTFVDPDSWGVISPAAVRNALRRDTALISVQMANNETGALQPVREIGAIAREERILFHCDAVQAFGHIPVDVRSIKADLLTISAHKFYGPRGAGVLFVRQGAHIPPIIAGGHQEYGIRGGTENVPAIWGMAAAAEAAMEDMTERAAREKALMDSFTGSLRALVPSCRALCGDGELLPGLRAYLLPDLPSEKAISLLDLKGIMVSGGAACATGDPRPSHVYMASGLSEDDAQCVIRVSIGRDTTKEMLDTAARAVSDIYNAHSR